MSKPNTEAPERSTKPYRDHLLERLQTPEEREGYLRAAFEENDASTFRRAVQDVCDSVNYRASLAPAGEGSAAVWNEAIRIIGDVDPTDLLRDERGAYSFRNEALAALETARATTPASLAPDAIRRVWDEAIRVVHKTFEDLPAPTELCMHVVLTLEIAARAATPSKEQD